MTFIGDDDAGFKKYLQLLETFISEQFISSSYLNAFKNIASDIPFISFGAFEIFFGETRDRVDLNICINSKLNEHKLFLEWLEKAQLKFDNDKIKTYDSIKKFCSVWKQDNFYLKPFIDKLWLVYDIESINDAIIDLWYYVQFTDNIFPFDNEIKSEIVLQTFSMADISLPNQRKEYLSVFLENISSTCMISGVGLRNNSSDIRVYLVFSKFDEILSFLKENSWTGDTALLQNDLSEFVEDINKFGLLVDLSSTSLQPQIGIELWFHNNNYKEQLTGMMQKLKQKHLCTSAQADSFIAWNGSFELSNNEENIDGLANRLQEDTFAGSGILKRKSAYVKIVYSPGNNIMAKGYAFFDKVFHYY